MSFMYVYGGKIPNGTLIRLVGKKFKYHLVNKEAVCGLFNGELC